MLASVSICNGSFMTLPSTSKPYVRWRAPSLHVQGINAHVRADRRGSGHVCGHVSRQWSVCPVHRGVTLVHVAVIPHPDCCSSLLSAFPTSHFASVPTCSSQDVRRNVIKPESDHVTPVLRTVPHGPQGSKDPLHRARGPASPGPCQPLRHSSVTVPLGHQSHLQSLQSCHARPSRPLHVLRPSLEHPSAHST